MKIDLEELLKQRKEIDKKIQELKSGNISNGCVKLVKEHYPTSRPDDWCVMISAIGSPRPTNRTIIRTTDKSEIIPMLDAAINDLTGLREKILGELDE